MRYIYAIALFLVVLMVGCSKSETPPAAPAAPPAAPTEPAAAPAAPPAAPTEPAVAPPAAPTEPAAPALPKGDITIAATGLSPAELTVKVGDTVTWVNAQEDKNAALGTPILSGPIAPKQTFSKKFDAAGTYSYMEVISKKSGKITVKAAETAGTGATA